MLRKIGAVSLVRKETMVVKVVFKEPDEGLMMETGGWRRERVRGWSKEDWTTDPI